MALEPTGGVFSIQLILSDGHTTEDLVLSTTLGMFFISSGLALPFSRSAWRLQQASTRLQQSSTRLLLASTDSAAFWAYIFMCWWSFSSSFRLLSMEVSSRSS